MTAEELTDTFGEYGWKQLSDEVYRRCRFTSAKVEVEEHYVAVYAGKTKLSSSKQGIPGIS